jgi:hypothetical protein
MADPAAIPIPRPFAARLFGFARTSGFPWIPALILALVIAAAIGGEDLAPFDPNALDLGAAFKPPAWALRDAHISGLADEG